MEVVQNDMDPMSADERSDEEAQEDGYSVVDNSGESATYVYSTTLLILHSNIFNNRR